MAQSETCWMTLNLNGIMQKRWAVKQAKLSTLQPSDPLDTKYFQPWNSFTKKAWHMVSWESFEKTYFSGKSYHFALSLRPFTCWKHLLYVGRSSNFVWLWRLRHGLHFTSEKSSYPAQRAQLFFGRLRCVLFWTFALWNVNGLSTQESDLW